jgi:pimeloyl-ACP methyl ester carboxylesterase
MAGRGTRFIPTLRRGLLGWAALLLLALLAGCASPAERIDASAAALGWSRSVDAGIGYAHVVYRNQSQAGGTLHVYIDNDGTPWAGRYAVAPDPTPERALMLELMALDPAPSLYLGRPCYLGLAAAAPCTPLDWTHGRYAAGVVDSMAAALRRTVAAAPQRRIVLFGHSGGGTLAALLAARLPETVGVVTLGANLDIDAWARLHGYTPLRDSVNPMAQAPLPPGIIQKHYVGSADRNVPPALLRAYRDRHPGAVVTEVPGVDHDCCWRGAWPGILQDLEAALAP